MNSKILHVIFILGSLLSASSYYANSAEALEIGTVEFATTGSEQAQEYFQLGLAYLHNFAWKQSRAAFITAQNSDTTHKMAYWGEAFVLSHPFLPNPDFRGAAKILSSFTSTQATETTELSTLEQEFLEVLDSYVRFEGDMASRLQVFLDGMQKLHRSFPEHNEARAIYALALLSSARYSQDTGWRQALRYQARVQAQDILRNNSSHPGALHYLIHSLDDTDNAFRGLIAANRYRDLVVDLPHARHMPTHIYGYLGRWFDVAELNETALYLSRGDWETGDSPYDQIHAQEFGQYGDAQLGDFKAAKLWISRAEETLEFAPGDEQALKSLSAMRGRYILESRDWQHSTLSSGLDYNEVLAIGLSAINMQNMPLAIEANQQLTREIEAGTAPLPLHIAQAELEASIIFENGDIEQALDKIATASDMSLEGRVRSLLPDPAKPVYELEGELLLRSGRYQAAINAFELSDQVYPHRPWTLLGLARGHLGANNMSLATTYYQEVLKYWSDTNLLGVAEAKTYLATHNPIDPHD